MIGGRLLRAPGCGTLIGPAYLAAEACLLTSFQKLLIVSFASWAGWIAWRERAADRDDEMPAS